MPGKGVSRISRDRGKAERQLRGLSSNNPALAHRLARGELPGYVDPSEIPPEPLPIEHPPTEPLPAVDAKPKAPAELELLPYAPDEVKPPLAAREDEHQAEPEAEEPRRRRGGGGFLSGFMGDL
jgi:hypothetical protein